MIFMITRFKIFEINNELDPYGEENWNDLYIEDIKDFLKNNHKDDLGNIIMKNIKNRKHGETEQLLSIIFHYKNYPDWRFVIGSIPNLYLQCVYDDEYWEIEIKKLDDIFKYIYKAINNKLYNYSEEKTIEETSEAVRWYNKGKLELDTNRPKPVYNDFIADDRFREFLIDNNAYEKYLYNVEKRNNENFKLRMIKNEVEDYDYINYAFQWDYTEEGFIFWKILSDEWRSKN